MDQIRFRLGLHPRPSSWISGVLLLNHVNREIPDVQAWFRAGRGTRERSNSESEAYH